MLIVSMISEICSQNDFPLDIYNYEGYLLKSKNKGILKYLFTHIVLVFVITALLPIIPKVSIIFDS